MPHLIIVHSQFESEDDVKTRLEKEIENVMHNIANFKPGGFVNSIEKAAEVIKTLKEKTTGLVILTATGGTEEYIQKIVSEIETRILIWANGQNNSFAASLEAYAFLKDKFPVKLYHSESMSNDRQRVQKFIRVCETIGMINNSNVGIIGEPSDWLLTSKGVKSFGQFSTTLTAIKLKELISEVKDVMDAESHSRAGEFKKMYGDVEVSDEALQGSAKVSIGLRRVIERNKLNAVTIRCFDLLENKYTACMGLSVQNDEGVVAGCEGDLHALFSMMLGTYITQKPSWMANPSGIDKTDNSIVLAHCTVPSKMIADLSKSTLKSHMESGLSTGIQGQMPKKKVTIFRIGGEFNKLTAVTGKIVNPFLNDNSLCRTQIKINLNCNINDWIESSLGNHQIMVYDDIIQELSDFCHFTGVDFNWLNN
ncbi:hypothetical protein ACFLR4_04330 [Bacteroidota bacterium]